MAGTNALIALIRNIIPPNWNGIVLRRMNSESRKSTGNTKAEIVGDSTDYFYFTDSANCFADGEGGLNKKGSSVS